MMHILLLLINSILIVSDATIIGGINTEANMTNIGKTMVVPLTSIHSIASIIVDQDLCYDFELDPSPGHFIDTSPLLSLPGVHFQGSGAVLNQCGNFGEDAHSGDEFMAFNPSAIYPNGQRPTGPFRAIFDSICQGFEIWFFSKFGGEVTIKGFDVNNQVIEEYVVQVTGEWQLLTLIQNIKIVEVTYNTTQSNRRISWVFDDMKCFNPICPCADPQVTCEDHGMDFLVPKNCKCRKNCAGNKCSAAGGGGWRCHGTSVCCCEALDNPSCQSEEVATTDNIKIANELNSGSATEQVTQVNKASMNEETLNNYESNGIDTTANSNSNSNRAVIIGSSVGVILLLCVGWLVYSQLNKEKDLVKQDIEEKKDETDNSTIQSDDPQIIYTSNITDRKTEDP